MLFPVIFWVLTLHLRVQFKASSFLKSSLMPFPVPALSRHNNPMHTFNTSPSYYSVVVGFFACLFLGDCKVLKEGLMLQYMGGCRAQHEMGTSSYSVHMA